MAHATNARDNMGPMPEPAGGTPSAIGEGKPRRKSAKEIAEEAFLAELGRAARYLVVRNGYIVAAFADEDDALMFEAEMADVDRSRPNEADGTTCEVLDRRGRRLGGYWISGGKVMAYLRA